MIKILTLDLQKRILIVEFPEGSTQREIKRYPPDKYFHLRCQTNKTEQYTEYEGYALFFKDFGGKKKYPSEINLICKGSELNEEIAKSFIKIEDFGLYQDHRIKHVKFCERSSALDSFISAIEANGMFWNNPLQSTKPTDDLTFYDSKKEREITINKWQEAESKTFHPDRVIISEIV